MSTIRIGDSIMSVDVGASDGIGDPAQVRELTLTNGAKPFDAVVSAALSATTTLWTAPNHGVSATTASADLVAIIIDPEQAADDSLPIDLILTYTTVSSTGTTTEAIYLVAKREHGVLKIPGEGRKSDATQVFLTKVEAKNRNTTAATVRIQVWN